MSDGRKTNVKRGSAFERRLESAFKMIPGCTIEKTAPPFKVTGMQGKMKVGFFEAKGMCDFEGAIYGHHVAIDAKRINGAKRNRWNFKGNIKDHQIARLSLCNAWGSICGILLQWDVDSSGGKDPAPVFYLPWSYINGLMVEEVKSVSLDDLRGRGAAVGGVVEINSLDLLGGMRGLFTKFLEGW